ncbi:hypothetical protein [Salinactinospora qingdaonensis]|uniref:Uncharacterized protein n=1 Tax=Salinactinospora qingdaonensis TaxID=702744 RepID=A0ABP7G390_9ACTN
MTKERLAWTGIAVTAALALAAMALLIGWWTLLWGPALVVLAGLIFHLVRLGGVSAPPANPVERRVVTPEVPDEEAAQPPVSLPRQGRQLSRVALPSAHEDYDFLFSAMVYWRPRGSMETGAEGMATSLVLERAGTLALSELPEDYEIARHQIAAEVGQVMWHEEGALEVWAEEICLELDDEDTQRLRQLRDMRKDEEIRNQQREIERNRRAYLKNDVLASPGRAVVWWLARDPERIEETLGHIATLSRLSAAANGTEVPWLYRELAGELGHRHERWSEAVVPDVSDGEGRLARAGALSVNGHSGNGVAPEGVAQRADTAEEAEEAEPLLHLPAFIDAVAGDDGSEREMAVDRLARLLEKGRQPELAQRLRERYGVPGVSTATEPAPSVAPAAPPAEDAPPAADGEPPAATDGGGPSPSD